MSSAPFDFTGSPDSPDGSSDSFGPFNRLRRFSRGLSPFRSVRPTRPARSPEATQAIADVHALIERYVPIAARAIVADQETCLGGTGLEPDDATADATADAATYAEMDTELTHALRDLRVIHGERGLVRRLRIVIALRLGGAMRRELKRRGWREVGLTEAGLTAPRSTHGEIPAIQGIEPASEASEVHGPTGPQPGRQNAPSSRTRQSSREWPEWQMN